MTAVTEGRAGNGHQSNTTILRAAATRIQLGNRKVAKAQAGKREDWQIEAYGYYDDTGILKNVIMFRGNQMAKVRLFPAVRPLDDPEGAPIPVTDPESGISADLARRAQVEIERIKGESGGTAEILRLLDMNKELVGECFIVGRGPRVRTEQDPVTGDPVEVETLESWDVRSILEVEVGQDGVFKVANPLTNVMEQLDPAIDTLVRVWQRHPAYAKRADCHLRGVLTDLEALVLLTNEVKAESKSRQNNGILFIPNTMNVTIPSRTNPAADDADPDAIDDYPHDEAEPAALSIGQAIEEAMLEPIGDPGSAWSVLRLLIIGPPEDGDKIKPIDLNRPSSDQLEPRIAARKEAIAQGLNAPIEVALGHMNTTYANAAQIDADIFEKHLEPACVTICDMWTIGLLQPALIAGGGGPDAERIIIWYDPKQLLDNVDPAENADKGREYGAIGNDAWRRYKGFSEDDAPEPIELLIDAILKQRTWDPALVDAVVKEIAPDLEVPPPSSGAASAASATAQASLVEALARYRDEGPTAATRSALLSGLFEVQQTIRASAKAKPPALGASEKLAAVDVSLFTRTHTTLNRAMERVLERAGNRLKAKAGPTREQLRLVAPVYAASIMGAHGLELAGLTDEDLIDQDAFEPAIGQFHRDARHAQERSLAIAAGLAGLSTARKRQLVAQQAAHLNDATLWMRDQLHGLASDRLFDPDDREPVHGEYDPESRVPAGLVRYAMAVAGGATALTLASPDDSKYVVLSNDRPAGGIGTGELIRNAVTESGDIVIEGYQWDYGAAFRQHPYEPHEELDGEVVESPLDFGEDDFGPAFPGDHPGCSCGPLIPVYAQVSQGEGPAPHAADLFGEGD